MSTATRACPAWCGDRTEMHRGYEEATAGGLIRTHSHDVGSVAGSTTGRAGEHAASAFVDLMATETALLSEAGVRVSLDQPRVVIWAEYVLLDEVAARQLAALLLAAADHLDKIAGR